MRLPDFSKELLLRLPCFFLRDKAYYLTFRGNPGHYNYQITSGFRDWTPYSYINNWSAVNERGKEIAGRSAQIRLGGFL